MHCCHGIHHTVTCNVSACRIVGVDGHQTIYEAPIISRYLRSSLLGL